MTNNILDTPKIVKVEKQYQIIRTILNLVAIGLVAFALFRLTSLANQDRIILSHIDTNQNVLLCIVRESTNPAHTKVSIINGEFKYSVDNSYIDKCIQANK